MSLDILFLTLVHLASTFVVFLTYMHSTPSPTVDKHAHCMAFLCEKGRDSGELHVA